MSAPNRADVHSNATAEARGVALLRDPLLNKGTALHRTGARRAGLARSVCRRMCCR